MQFCNFFQFCIAGLIDYNFHCFRKAIQDVFEVREKASLEEENEEITVNGMPDQNEASTSQPA